MATTYHIHGTKNTEGLTWKGLVRASIYYGDRELTYQETVENIDEAQAVIDGWRRLGKECVALHRGPDRHDMYVGA